MPEARGRRVGERLLRQRLGFQRLSKPMGATGHFGCDSWYALDLKA